MADSKKVSLKEREAKLLGKIEKAKQELSRLQNKRKTEIGAMAVAFARVSIHTRSHGHSAVAGAAYRAGEKFIDERTGEEHNFENRQDVIYSNIMLPENADQAFEDREFLWNQAELAEKRVDSQVAKDVILALPKELKTPEQIELARNFAQYHFVKHGLVADIAIHNHGDGNPHAHIYVSTRRLQGNAFDKHKARDLNPTFAKGRITSQDYWGEQWRDFQNDFFKTHAIDITVDANYIIAQRHEGQIRNNEETKENHYIKAENQLNRQASYEIALNDPDSVLNILGHKHAVFSESDLTTFLNKNTETPAQFQTALTQVKNHKDLVELGPGEDGRARYTTRANYTREADMQDHAHDLMLNNSHLIPKQSVTAAAATHSLSTEQTKALTHLARSADICTVVGRAGTGKSYMMKPAKEMWEQAGYRVRGMAVSGIASKGLEAETGIASSTIHSIKMQIIHGTFEANKNDILVMDEAGMTDHNDMAIMVEMAKRTGAKLVLIGDHDQLQPINSGAPFRAIIERVGFAELQEIRRQDDQADREASSELAKGKVNLALDHYLAKDQLHLIQAPESDPADGDKDEGGEGGDSGTSGGIAAMFALVTKWCDGLTPDNIDQRLVLAHRNIDIAMLNKLAREAIKQRGHLSDEEHTVTTSSGKLKLATGDRILFLRNNKDLGINNGEFATVTNISGQSITVEKREGQGQKRLTFNPNDYQDFNYGYAATVHKSQGVTIDNTYVYLGGRGWNRHLAYVALTRHRKQVDIFADKAAHPSINSIEKALSRDDFKDNVIDFPVSYAIRRGFNPDGIVGKFIDKVAGIKQAAYDKWLYLANYEAYLLQQKYRAQLSTAHERRKQAKTVARYVDLHRGLGKQWRTLRASISKDQPLSKQAGYSDTYTLMLEKNALASQILEKIDNYTTALSRNRVSIAQLEKAAQAHTRFDQLQQYTQVTQQTDSKQRISLAAQIAEHIPESYGAINHLTKQHSIDKASLIKKIKQDATAFHREQAIKNLSETEKQNFCQVDRYVAQEEHLRTLWRDIHLQGGLHNISDADLRILHTQSALADKLAHDLCGGAKGHTAGIAFYKLENSKLCDATMRHKARQKIQELCATDNTKKRDAMSAELLSDRRHYHLIHEAGIDWNKLRKQSQNHHHRLALQYLSSEQQHYYRLVRDYQQARIDAGIAWSELLTDKGSNITIPNTRWQFTIKLSNTRDKLAYEVVASAQSCIPFIEKTTLKLSDIEKHANRFIENQVSLANHENQAAKATQPKAQETTHTKDDYRYYYDNAEPILDTLGERYLREHLGIESGLSAFRYHPRIRDDKIIRADNEGQGSDSSKNEKQITTYHPGIVVCAKNKNNEITATQTILLEPNTGNQLDDQQVGNVKRIRGEAEHSVVQIHQGTSNHTIIAEDLETAASLIDVEPTANIYAIPGNIKNAAHLGWLAEKHQANTFFFAVNNDGHNAKNIKVLQEVAQSLHDEKGIQCELAILQIKDREQCTFNEVLRECDATEVKNQLIDHTLISVQKEKNIENLNRQQIHDRLHSSAEEWARLKTLNHDSVNDVIDIKDRLARTDDPTNKENLKRSYKNYVVLMLKQPKLPEKIQSVAPNLYQEFNELMEQDKPFEIDWRSETIAAEIKKLAGHQDELIDYLVSFHKSFTAYYPEPDSKLYKDRMDSLILRITKNKPLAKTIEKLAPNLLNQGKKLALSKERDRDIDYHGG